MIRWNYLIYEPLKQEADQLGIEPLTAYLEQYYGAHVRNGDWIIFKDSRQESLFRLKYSEHLLNGIFDWIDINNENPTLDS